MRTLTRGAWFRRRLVAFVVALAAGLPGQALAQDVQRQVLVLYSARRDAQIVTVGEREFPRILDQGLREGLDYYSEYIDRSRFPEDSYKTAFRDFLRLKYRDKRFDVIIAVQDLALEFVREYRTELFGDSAIVYFANSASARPPNSTGLVADVDFSSTLAFATQLQPDVREVFVVTGTEAGDKEYENLARTQFQAFESQLKITYLSGLPTQQLLQRLSSLPPHSAVYYVIVNRDGTGEYFHPLDYLDRIAAVANAPVYCWVDSAMDRGILGGSLKSQQAQAEATAKLALRVLHGESAESIPVTSPKLNVNQVDWRQLRRWGISEARVPAGTLIRFREPSVWERYRIYILAAIAVLLAQSLLIVGLLLHRARRRTVERELRTRETELRGSYERIRDLGQRLLSAQEAERSRIARELHDDFGQQLALLSIHLEQLNGANPIKKNDADSLARAALERVHSTADSLRALSHRLHPAKLHLIGLVPALTSLQRELTRSDFTVTFRHEDVPAGLPHEITLCLYRVVQEALQNAIKHGAARQVSVNLHRAGEQLLLTVVDDGVGFSVEDEWGKGLGLLSMAERLESIDGTVKIHSRPGAGTQLEVSVPLPPVQESVAAAV
jgi:signal transduction histidine kinase